MKNQDSTELANVLGVMYVSTITAVFILIVDIPLLIALSLFISEDILQNCYSKNSLSTTEVICILSISAFRLLSICLFWCFLCTENYKSVNLLQTFHVLLFIVWFVIGIKVFIYTYNIDYNYYDNITIDFEPETNGNCSPNIVKLIYGIFVYAFVMNGIVAIVVTCISIRIIVWQYETCRVNNLPTNEINNVPKNANNKTNNVPKNANTKTDKATYAFEIYI
eukprot:109614_1